MKRFNRLSERIAGNPQLVWVLADPQGRPRPVKLTEGTYILGCPYTEDLPGFEAECSSIKGSGALALMLQTDLERRLLCSVHRVDGFELYSEDDDGSPLWIQFRTVAFAAEC